MLKPITFVLEVCKDHMGVPSKLGVESDAVREGAQHEICPKTVCVCYHKKYFYPDCQLPFLLLEFVRHPCTIRGVNVQISYTVAFMSAKEFTRAC